MLFITQHVLLVYVTFGQELVATWMDKNKNQSLCLGYGLDVAG